ncbi:DUF2262 domain-containing protein [Leptotrichia sp. oral taxon 223]|uniref:DUF2262 domain-containing protein n=1 Tax=Leptotrichia sp. oral taxon 223 TaxID=712363 RepID=UPI0015C06FEB|nr:DUF2262 domain-containing protein [Leptotrichia sp. oral taxon 223]NWO19506.1 DUF2262 domain-containing protein [Leptotrichia sp. oral taxon 223]
MSNAIKDEIFGEIKNFETEVEWLGRKISVSFDGGIEHDWNEEKKLEEVKGAIEQFKVMYFNQKEWDERMRNRIVEDLMEVAEDWFASINEEDLDEMIAVLEKNSNSKFTEKEKKELKDQKVSKEVFKNGIYLEGLNITSDGDFAVYYYDDEVFFAGHEIELMGNVSGEFSYEADIVG